MTELDRRLALGDIRRITALRDAYAGAINLVEAKRLYDRGQEAANYKHPHDSRGVLALDRAWGRERKPFVCGSTLQLYPSKEDA